MQLLENRTEQKQQQTTHKYNDNNSQHKYISNEKENKWEREEETEPKNQNKSKVYWE